MNKPKPSTVEEMISWHRDADDLPDSDLTVLIYGRDLDPPVWLGFHNGEEWCLADGMILAVRQVHAWANLPSGGVP